MPLGLSLSVLATVLAGCSTSTGVAVVPEHQELGVVNPADGPAVAEFEIVNGLRHELNITEMFPSCQCTTVGPSVNPIPPGKTSILRAEADLSKQAGVQSFSVTFLTDDAAYPTKRVSFDAVVAADNSQTRQLMIGTFDTNTSVRVELPVASFSQGVVELDPASDGRFDFDEVSTLTLTTTLLTTGARPTLLIEGVTPDRPGLFTKRL